MNHLLRGSLQRLSELRGRLRPFVKTVRERADRRRAEWFERRERDVDTLKKVAFQFRDKTLDFIDDWVEPRGSEIRSRQAEMPVKTKSSSKARSPRKAKESGAKAGRKANRSAGVGRASSSPRAPLN